jgi:uncharacterized protein YoxC
MGLAVVVVVAFLVPAILQIKRAAKNVADMLEALRGEIDPLASRFHETLDEHRQLVHQATQDLARLEELAEGAKAVAEQVKGFVALGATLRGVNQMAAVVRGVRRGFDVFVSRLNQQR